MRIYVWFTISLNFTLVTKLLTKVTTPQQCFHAPPHVRKHSFS